MPPKRPASNIDDENTRESGREAKKQRTVRHRGKLDAVVEDFLDMLSPATGGSLAKFNADEKEEKRRGVVPIDIVRVQKQLEKLRVAKDIRSLDAKLMGIDSYLKKFQDGYNGYLAKHSATTEVELTVDGIIWRIEAARGQLPGMFPHWMDYCGKLNITTLRY